MKAKLVICPNGERRIQFQCPGCAGDERIHNGLHEVRVASAPGEGTSCWAYNANLEKPTFHPSVLVTWEGGDPRQKFICHSYVRDGRIEFLGDCTHALAGQTVELPEIEQ